MPTLNTHDFTLLDAAKKSNGGGVREANFRHAAIKRMEAAGYIQRKKGDNTGAFLWVITRDGREALERHMNRSASVEELLAEEGRKGLDTTPIHLDSPPWCSDD